jgi:outer membrane murein-binding lipoprotein Lpp
MLPRAGGSLLVIDGNEFRIGFCGFEWRCKMAKNLMTILIVAAVSFGSLLIAGCESDAQVGSAIGALAGAGIGQLAGGDSEATLIGAAVGGTAGYMLGNESERQKAQAERAYMRQEMRTVAVNITNSNGSVSQVRLRRHGVGYVGTRGEYYHRLPTEDQLRPIYGF